MPTLAFYQNYVQVVLAAEQCLAQDMQMPTLILIYSLIDSFAWATAEDKNGEVRARFEDWLNSYVLPSTSLACTATELYAARCGLLHTLTSKAKLNASGKVRQIAYSWGTADPQALEKSLELIGRPDIVAVHTNNLLDAVKEGMARTVESGERNQALMKRLEDAAALHLIRIEADTLVGLVDPVMKG
jgi:cytosine/adenosine deaminase-related metal-dependent hydrolase